MVSLVYIRKEEKLKIRDLSTHLKKLGKKQQIKPWKEKTGNRLQQLVMKQFRENQ